MRKSLLPSLCQREELSNVAEPRTEFFCRHVCFRKSPCFLDFKRVLALQWTNDAGFLNKHRIPFESFRNPSLEIFSFLNHHHLQAGCFAVREQAYINTNNARYGQQLFFVAFKDGVNILSSH